MSGRSGPPIAEVAAVALCLIVIGGVYLASHLPNEVPLTLPTILLVAAAVLLAADLLALSRLKDFAWRRFRTVGKWALLADGTGAGLIEYSFVRNDARGGPLVILSLSLLLYTIIVPMLTAFTVARHVPND